MGILYSEVEYFRLIFLLLFPNTVVTVKAILLLEVFSMLTYSNTLDIDPLSTPRG